MLGGLGQDHLPLAIHSPCLIPVLSLEVQWDSGESLGTYYWYGQRVR